MMIKTMIHMALRNISRRLRFVTAVVLCVSITTCSLVSVWSVLDATKLGLALSRERQGSDVLVYPHQTEISDSSMMYSGVPQSVYMPEDILDKLNNSMVSEITWQFYMQTLPSAGCCAVDEEYRLVGIDWESDFVARPWLVEQGIETLEDGQILVGCNIPPTESETQMILNYPMKVISYLEPTGTSLDDSIIINMDHLRKLAKINFLPSFFGEHTPDDLITCAMIRLNEGVEAQDYIASLDGVEAKVVSVSSVQNTLQGELDTLAKILSVLLLVIVLLCCVTLTSQFRVLTLTRSKEVGYLRSIGMSRPQVYSMFLLEFGLISLIGALLGSLAGLAAAVPAAAWIKENIALPLSPWDPAFLLRHGLIGIGIALGACLLATVSPLRSITRISPHEMIAKGEL